MLILPDAVISLATTWALELIIPDAVILLFTYKEDDKSTFPVTLREPVICKSFVVA